MENKYVIKIDNVSITIESNSNNVPSIKRINTNKAISTKSTYSKDKSIKPRREFKDYAVYDESYVGLKYNHLTILEVVPSLHLIDQKQGVKRNIKEMSSSEKTRYYSTRCKVQCECGSEPFITYISLVTCGVKRICDKYSCPLSESKANKNCIKRKRILNDGERD